jgi:hypothetical protein
MATSGGMCVGREFCDQTPIADTISKAISTDFTLGSYMLELIVEKSPFHSQSGL